MTQDAHTHTQSNRAAYDAIANEWNEARRELPAREEAILAMTLAGVPSGSRVLDLGCGTGYPIAAHLIRRGFAVTGIDQSAHMLAKAHEQLPTGEWVEATLEGFTICQPVAAAIAWDSLFHIPRAAHEGIFRRVHRALLPGARFALTLGGSDHPAFTDVMFGQSFFYDSWPPEQAVALLRQSGFNVVHQAFLEQPTDKVNKGRIVIVAAAV